MTAANRVEAFLDAREQIGGPSARGDVLGNLTRGGDEHQLTVTDLRELVEKARLADAVRASRSTQRGFRRPAGDRLRPGQVDQRVVAPLAVMRAQDAGKAPKFERPTAISMVNEAPLGPWVEVNKWSHR